MLFPITCIDNFFKYPDSIREFAESLEYTPEPKGMWSGKRSPELDLISPSLKNAVCTKYLKLYFASPMVSYKCITYFQKSRS